MPLGFLEALGSIIGSDGSFVGLPEGSALAWELQEVSGL